VQVVVGAEAGGGGVQAAVAVERQLALVERGQLLAARVVARAGALGGHGRLVVRRRRAMVPERVLAGACARAAATGVSAARLRLALLGAARQAAGRRAAGRAGRRRRRAAGPAAPAPRAARRAGTKRTLRQAAGQGQAGARARPAAGRTAQEQALDGRGPQAGRERLGDQRDAARVLAHALVHVRAQRHLARAARARPARQRVRARERGLSLRRPRLLRAARDHSTACARGVRVG
jgi:hypothetical protein